MIDPAGDTVLPFSRAMANQLARGVTREPSAETRESASPLDLHLREFVWRELGDPGCFKIAYIDFDSELASLHLPNMVRSSLVDKLLHYFMLSFYSIMEFPITH